MSRYAAAHSTPQGPGDARPAALQIIKDEGLEGKLDDKVFVVTGGSSGIGIETVRFDDFAFAKGYEPWAAYGQSKTANIYLATEIERRYGRSRNLHATALHPGLIATGLQAHVPEVAEATRKDDSLRKLMKGVEQGAATTVWAAVGAEWAQKGGEVFGRVRGAGAAQAGEQRHEPG